MLQAVPYIKIIGGLIMSAVLFTNSSLGIVNSKIKDKAYKQQIEIQEDIDELINNYLDYEVDYIENWIEESDIADEITEDELVDIKSDALDSYINNEKFEDNGIYINQRMIDYMKKQLPDSVKEFIDKSQKYNTGQSELQRVVWFWLNYKNGDNFEWLRRQYRL